MTTLALFRHGQTDWNIQRRLQGRADIAITSDARQKLSKLQLPDTFSGVRCRTSPLVRAIETARCLNVCSFETDERLIEMDWGLWEGKTIANLRQELGTKFIAAEARGLDLTPPEGESPREVQNRLRPFMRDVAVARETTLAITHKGVIRALLSLALNWDLTGTPPFKLDWHSLHLFGLSTEGHPQIECLNVPLLTAGAHHYNSEDSKE